MPRSYAKLYGATARELVLEAAKRLRRFTYNDVAYYLYKRGFQVRLETIKREVRKLKDEGLIEEVGFVKRRKGVKPEKLFKYVGSVVC